jgi:CPA1 family monovalent cation:H+ antiporter
MEMLDLCALLLSLAAIFSYINFRFIKLPTTIGIMLIAMLISVSLVVLGHCGFEGIQNRATAVLEGIDFNKALMHGMLSFLLFSGALHVNLEDLARHKWIISILATFGVVMSTFIVGGSAWVVFLIIGIKLPFIYCLLFGSLIAPTDPIAVIGILKRAGVPKSLETKITGESLFNDGVAVVVFLVIMGIIAGGHNVTVGHIMLLFVEEAIGGIFFGFIIGWVAYLMLKSVDNYQVEVLLTLALVMGGYALAHAIHVSLKHATIFSFQPRSGPEILQATRKTFNKIGVGHRKIVLNKEFANKKFSNKIFTAAYAEKKLDSEFLVFPDSNQMILNEPSKLTCLNSK